MICLVTGYVSLRKERRYFDFKNFKICPHLDISFIFFIVYVP
jgi:hypothetical protein